MAIINTLHVYHMVAFKLNSAELFHHLMFIPTLGCVRMRFFHAT